MTETTIPPQWLEKETQLLELIGGYGTLAIAYSGGVDSTYLADVAHEAIGRHAWMLVADSPSIPRSELAQAAAIAEKRGWRLAILSTNEFENEEFLSNKGRRCYVCKNELFSRMKQFAADNGIGHVAYGETADDVFDTTRYGAIAAKEQGIVAPLQHVGMKKEMIRALSRRRNLPTWDKASFACLSSRFPTGTPLRVEDMAKVEHAEEVLKRLQFRQYRARHHGAVCRIEIDPADFPKILAPEIRDEILKEFTDAGYRYVTLDLAGYRTGSTAG